MTASNPSARARVGRRCAVHPARPAADDCPTCGRPRCASDAAADPTACGFDQPTRPAGHVVTESERLIRAGFAVYPIAIVGGLVDTQYIHDHLFSLIVPGVFGLFSAGAASFGAGRSRAGTVIALVAATLAVALGDRFFASGGISPISPIGQAGPPYIAAWIGVAAWPLLFEPRAPKRSKQPVSRSGSPGR